MGSSAELDVEGELDGIAVEAVDLERAVASSRPAMARQLLGAAVMLATVEPVVPSSSPTRWW